MDNYNRRTWLKTSLLTIAGTTLLLPEVKAKLIHETEKKYKLLGKAKDEAYWELVKAGFTFENNVHYFNTASLGPSPVMVRSATQKFRETLDAFPSKYGWGAWKEEKEQVREKVAKVLKVSAEEIALTHNTTEGMNLIASSLNLKEGDEVILSNHEHHTGTIPWIYHQEQKGVKLVRPKLPILPKSKEELVEIYRKAIGPRTRVISIVHMTNTNGMIMPIKEISTMAHEYGILVAVDGAQTLGMLDFDLHDLGCDFYAASGHKWLFSPKGMGVLYAKKEVQHHLKAMIVCSGYKDESIRRLENYNTRNLPELLGLGVAVDYLNLIGQENKMARIYALKHYFRSQIQKNPKLVIKSPEADELSAGITVVEVKDKAVKDVKQALFDNHNIDCRPMRSHSLNALRISLNIFNTKADIDYLVRALEQV
jgi:selenocysteine lyase/cysteine desulfurase